MNIITDNLRGRYHTISSYTEDGRNRSTIKILQLNHFPFIMMNFHYIDEKKITKN